MDPFKVATLNFSFFKSTKLTNLDVHTVSPTKRHKDLCIEHNVRLSNSKFA